MTVQPAQRSVRNHSFSGSERERAVNSTVAGNQRFREFETKISGSERYLDGPSRTLVFLYRTRGRCGEDRIDASPCGSWPKTQNARAISGPTFPVNSRGTKFRSQCESSRRETLLEPIARVRARETTATYDATSTYAVTGHEAVRLFDSLSEPERDSKKCRASVNSVEKFDTVPMALQHLVSQ